MEYHTYPYPLPDAEQERRKAIVEAYREIARHPLYLAEITTGWDFLLSLPGAAQPAEELLEVCILESDGRVLLESFVNPHGRTYFPSYSVNRITHKMVKDAPTWEQLLPRVIRAATGRRVATYDLKARLHVLNQPTGLPELSLDEAERFFAVKPIYARYYGKVYADGLTSNWLGLWRAARNLHIPHSKFHRAREDAQLTRLVLKHIGSQLVVRPPYAKLPQPASWLERWLERVSEVWFAPSRDSGTAPRKGATKE